MARSSFYRKQSIYRAIEAENARKLEPGIIRKLAIEPPKADERDPIEMARLAAESLRSAVA